MLAGKPIVASNCRPQQNLIESHNCGLIFESIPGFHDAIVRLLNDKALREEMGDNGRKAILNEYNTEKFKKNLLSIYKNSYL
jgi:glycosyltransferase involved in cell wall biosynthesis